MDGISWSEVKRVDHLCTTIGTDLLHSREQVQGLTHIPLIKKGTA